MAARTCSQLHMTCLRPSNSVGKAVGLCLLLVAGLLAMSGVAAAAPANKRVGAKPPIPAGAQRVGVLPAGISIQAVVTLQPRDPQALADYARAVSTPGSSAYHHYLTVGQFVQRFGPTKGQVNAVVASLRTRGLHPGAVSANHLSLTLSAPASQLASAFSTSFDRYRLASGRTAYANTSAPAVPSSVAGLIQGVVGLSNLALPHPLSVSHAAAGATSSQSGSSSASPPSPCAAATSQAATDHSYTANQIASAYGLTGLYSQSDFGSGTTVALYELEPYLSSDIQAYQSCNGTSATVTNVPVDGGAGSGAGQGEAALDVEDVAGLATQSSIHVYEGPNTNSGAYDTYNRIVTDNTAQVISTSWGLCESQETLTAAQAENTLFEEAATQGQSVFAASGDNGTTDCTSNSGRPVKQRAVDDPASQPYVTGVGGTSLTAVGPPPTESVWNNGNPNGAGGGGVSSFWSQPSYQSGFALSQSSVTCGSGGTSCREVPDVSANANQDDGYVIFYSGSWTSFGGTSVAAPTWASLTALANASSSCAGTEVGFANAALYRAAANHYVSDFNDVTSGNNNYDTVTGYSAGTGYDMASGLGSPKGTALAADLCGNSSDTVTFQTAPGNQSSTVDTPVAPVSSSASSSAGPISYSASDLPPGLSIDSATGTISGMPTAAGTYQVTERAVDSDYRVASTQFTWVVNSGSTTTTTTASTRTTSSTTTSPPPAKVTITPAGSQTGRVRTAASLLVTATDSRGQKLTYSASGLPAGLGIGSTSGLISGTPTRAGVSSVTVTARDSSGSVASITFRWTIAGRPSVASRSLKLRSGKPQLVLKLNAGSSAAALRSVTLQPRSAAIRLSGRRTALSRGILATSGSRLKVSDSVRKGSLTISVRRAAGARTLIVTVSAPELSLSRSVTTSLQVHRRTTVRLTLVVRDAQGVKTTLSTTV
jgi:hypothetical protein